MPKDPQKVKISVRTDRITPLNETDEVSPAPPEEKPPVAAPPKQLTVAPPAAAAPARRAIAPRATSPAAAGESLKLTPEELAALDKDMKENPLPELVEQAPAAAPAQPAAPTPPAPMPPKSLPTPKPEASKTATSENKPPAGAIPAKPKKQRFMGLKTFLLVLSLLVLLAAGVFAALIYVDPENILIDYLVSFFELLQRFVPIQ